MGARPGWDPPRTDPATGTRNGLPLARPCIYRGDGESKRDEEVQDFLRRVRARVRGTAAGPEHVPLAGSLATPFEFHAERRDLAVVPVPAAAARYMPAPGPHGHRTAFVAPNEALAARLAPAPPPRPKAARRCRRCGYLKTRCACGGKR